MTQQLLDSLSDLNEELEAAIEKASTSRGPAKAAASRAVTALKDKKVKLETQIKSSTPAKTAKTAKTDGGRHTIKNVGRFLLHNDGVRFPPGIEVESVLMSGFVKAQIAAGLFVVMGG